MIRSYDQRCLSCPWQDEIHIEPFVNPPCPSCGGETERLWSAPRGGGHFVIGDEFVGGRVYNNLGHEPVRIQSRSELRAVLKARGLQEFVTHAGGLEGDRSPHTTRWASVDLEAGRVLAERQATTRAPLASADQDPGAPSEATMRLAKIAWEIESAKL